MGRYKEEKVKWMREVSDFERDTIKQERINKREARIKRKKTKVDCNEMLRVLLSFILIILVNKNWFFYQEEEFEGKLFEKKIEFL